MCKKLNLLTRYKSLTTYITRCKILQKNVDRLTNVFDFDVYYEQNKLDLS